MDLIGSLRSSRYGLTNSRFPIQAIIKLVALFSNSNPPPRFRTSLTGNHEEEGERLRRWHEPIQGELCPSRGSFERRIGASIPPFINGNTVEVEETKRRSNRNSEERRGKQYTKKETENRTAANSFERSWNERPVIY